MYHEYHAKSIGIQKKDEKFHKNGTLRSKGIDKQKDAAQNQSESNRHVMLRNEFIY